MNFPRCLRRSVLPAAAVVAFVVGGGVSGGGGGAGLWIGPASGSVMAGEIQAGAAIHSIMPKKLPISVNGGFADRMIAEVHDPLHARCIVLSDGVTKVALVVADSCMLPREILDPAKKLASEKTGIPASNILISATHTHSAPTAGSVFQSDPQPEYLEQLPGDLAAGIEQAASRLEPAEFAFARGTDGEQVFNRRWKTKPETVNLNPFGGRDAVATNPGYNRGDLIEMAGPIDPEICMIYIRSVTGRPIALWSNYSLHYVGDVGGISADYFGVYCDRMTQLLKAADAQPPFVAAMSNGTSGDINNHFFSGPVQASAPVFGRCTLVAESVAKASLAGLSGELKFHREATFAVAEEEMTLGVRKPTPEELERAKKILAAAAAAGKTVLQTSAEVYARESVKLADYPDTVTLKLQAMRLGDIGVCAIPCEVFCEIGLELKAKSPLRNTFTVSLANGYNGYLCTPRQHGYGGYETWRARSSYLEVDSSPRITASLLRLLDAVSK
jgi:hypothetical protein